MGAVGPENNQDNNPEEKKSSLLGFSFSSFSFRKKEMGSWQGRVYLLQDKESPNHYIAYKFARISDRDGANLKLEEKRLRQGKKFNIPNVPEVISSVKPLSEIIGKIPKDLNPEYVLAFKAQKESRQYISWRYTDVEPSKRPWLVQVYSLKNLSDLCRWIERGYIHTSLSPLTHSDVFDETWFWNVNPVGEVQDLRESLRHTNMRRTGLDDLEHIKKIDQYLNLEFSLGQALVEWMITTTYAAFINEVPIKANSDRIIVQDILAEGFEYFLKSLGAEVNKTEANALIENFVNCFAREWNFNSLRAPTKDKPAALTYLVNLGHLFISLLNDSEKYKQLKDLWLKSTKTIRSEELLASNAGLILKKSWKESKIDFLQASGDLIKTLSLQTPPKAFSISNSGELLVITDGRLLSFTPKSLELKNEALGNFEARILVDEQNRVITINENREVEVRDIHLNFMGSIAVESSLNTDLLLVSKNCKGLVVAEKEACKIFAYELENFSKVLELSLDQEILALNINNQSNLIVGGNENISLYNLEGTCLARSLCSNPIASIIVSANNLILAREQYSNVMLIFDQALNLISKIVPYGSKHKLLLYSSNMELLHEFSKEDDPFKILESKKFELLVFKRDKNMALVRCLEG